MVAASLQAQAAIQGAVATNQRLDDSLKANNANWQESADSQTAAMNEYHNAERALAAQAVAQQQAAEQAAAAAEAFEEQEAALAKLLGQIDPVVRELGRLDQMEEQLRGFKASGILDPEGFDIYNAKVQEMRSRPEGLAAGMQLVVTFWGLAPIPVIRFGPTSRTTNTSRAQRSFGSPVHCPSFMTSTPAAWWL